MAIKGWREVETLKEEADDAGVDDDEVASGGRRRPTMATTVANAATPIGAVMTLISPVLLLLPTHFSGSGILASTQSHLAM